MAIDASEADANLELGKLLSAQGKYAKRFPSFVGPSKSILGSLFSGSWSRSRRGPAEAAEILECQVAPVPVGRCRSMAKLHRVLETVGPIHRQAAKCPFQNRCAGLSPVNSSRLRPPHHLVTFEAFRGQRSLVPFLEELALQDLRGCGLSFAKIRSFRAIGVAAELGQLEAQNVLRMGHPERAASLTKIAGVGLWTADMIGIFYCGDPDIWPEGDLVAQRTLQDLVGKKHSTAKVAATFSPWRSRLAMTMWKSGDG